MSKESERQTNDLRVLLRFIGEVSKTDTAEHVYAFGLNAICDIFSPKRAFVALAESESLPPEARPLQPGLLRDIDAPICAGEKLVGRFMLQYDQARAFSEHDLSLVALIAALAGFAIERIHEHDRLKKATDAAREEQRRKDELVAMAAHELRSTLTAVIGGTFLLRGGRADESERALDMIERNARLEVTLIEELLHVCQLDAGRVELRMSTLDLAPILERVIEENQPAAASSNTSLHAELGRPLMIRGDAQRLWQIFSNLVANSVRFASPNGEVRITADSDAAVARVCIRDNGVGMSEDQLTYIFERFRQAHIPRLKSYGGLGLGLAIVKDLVTMHGGTIVAESPGLGEGASFTVTFPHSPP